MLVVTLLSWTNVRAAYFNLLRIRARAYKKKFRCIILVVKNANVSSLLMSRQNKFVIVLLQVLPVFSYGIAILRKFIGTSSDLRTITECPQFWQSNAK